MKEIKLSVKVIEGIYSVASTKPFRIVSRICSKMEEIASSVQEGQEFVVIPADLSNELAMFINEEPYYEIHGIAKAFNAEVIEQIKEFQAQAATEKVDAIDEAEVEETKSEKAE